MPKILISGNSIFLFSVKLFIEQGFSRLFAAGIGLIKKGCFRNNTVREDHDTGRNTEEVKHSLTQRYSQVKVQRGFIAR